MFYLDVSFSNPVGFKPMDFSPRDSTVRKPHLGDSLHFLPVAVSVEFFKPFPDLDRRSFRYDFPVVNCAQYFSYSYVCHFVFLFFSECGTRPLSGSYS